MFRVVVNLLLRNSHFRGLAQWRTRVQVAVVLGKGAGTDFQANAMPGFEDQRGVPAIDVDAIATTAVLGSHLATRRSCKMKQFPSIEKLDSGILYILELASSLSVLLPAFGLIASMANVLTKGSVLGDNLLMQRIFIEIDGVLPTI
jgi:hypothetical protein